MIPSMYASLQFLLSLHKLVPEGEFYCPELYSHQISDGTNLYAMVFKPHNFQPGRKYPTVLHIYGGPEVQVVSNTFKVSQYRKKSCSLFTTVRNYVLYVITILGHATIAIAYAGSSGLLCSSN